MVAWHLVKVLREAVLETCSSAISLGLYYDDYGYTMETNGDGIILIMTVTML